MRQVAGFCWPDVTFSADNSKARRIRKGCLQGHGHCHVVHRGWEIPARDLLGMGRAHHHRMEVCRRVRGGRQQVL